MRFSFLVFTLLVLASGARGQTGPAAIADRAGGLKNDAASGVAADAEGNVVMVGAIAGVTSFGRLTVTVDEAGCARAACQDGFVARLAPNGETLWVRRMGAPAHDDIAVSVALAGESYNPDADVLVSGTFRGEATWDGGANPSLTRTARGNSDAFLARYTASGDLLWVLQAGGDAEDAGAGVTAGATGGVWSGTFRGTATVGSETLMSEGGADGFVARVDTDGAAVWLRQIGGPGESDAADVSMTEFGDPLLVAGTFDGAISLGTTSLQSRGETDGYVARLSMDSGAVTWTQQLGGTGSDGLTSVASSNNTYAGIVAGWFSGEVTVGTDVLTGAGMTDVLIAAFETEFGDLAWGRRGGGPGADRALDAHTLGFFAIPVFDSPPQFDLPAFVSGVTVGAATFDNTGSGSETLEGQGQDGFLAAYTLGYDVAAGGELLSVFRLGGASQDRASGAATTFSFGDFPPPSGPNLFSLYLIAVGDFRESASLFGETVRSAGGSDLFLGKTVTCPDLFCLPTDAEPTPEASGVHLSVAPHPVSDNGGTLTVTLDAPGDLHIDLHDARGRRIATLTDGSRAPGAHRIVLPPLAPGTYLIRVSTPEATQSRVVTVVR